MLEIPSLRPETRYGMPTADQLLFNREYIVGYSYLFRQARWAMELIGPDNKRDEVERKDYFRADLRVPAKFRADNIDYTKSGHDKGHLVSSADRQATRMENSETFLLSNMSPQLPEFNRGIWQKLEEAVRDLANKYIEVYVVSGPIFNVGKAIEVIGIDNGNEVAIPVPHAYFKSVLAEKHTGMLALWSFILPNANSDQPLSEFLCPTIEIESRAGLLLWERLRGEKIDGLKNKKGRMWKTSRSSIS